MKKLLLAFFALIFLSQANAQWKQTSGPPSGDVYSITKWNNRIIVGSDKVYYSDDSGCTWHDASSYYQTIAGFAGIDSFLFATTTYGVIISHDSGITWINSSLGLPNYPALTGIASLGKKLFVISHDSAIFSSTDFGNTWSSCSSNITDTIFTSVGVSNGIVYCGTENGLYQSVDSGVLWSLISGSITNSIYVTALGVVDSIILLTTYDEVYRSTDGGNTWGEVNFGLPQFFSVNQISHSENEIFLSSTLTSKWLYKSIDGGQTWTSLSSGLSAGIIITTVTSIGSDLYAGSFYLTKGILHSQDDGLTWQPIGLPAEEALSLTTISNKIFACGFNRVFVSEDRAKSWKYFNEDFANIPYYTNGMTSTNGYVYLVANETGGIYRSPTNSVGGAWVDVFDQESTGILCITHYEGYIFVGTQNGFYRSADNGTTWTEYNDGLPNPPLVSAITKNDDFLFAATIDSGVYSSADDGSSWVRTVNYGMPDIPISNSLVSVENFLFTSSDFHGGILVSGDDGDSWTLQSDGLGISGNKILGTDGGNVFATDFGNNFFYSTDLGITWDTANEGIDSGVYILSLALDDSFLYVGTSAGVWKRTREDFPIGIQTVHIAKPVSIFPNPTSDFITFDLSNFPNKKFTLTIYNLNGQQVNHYSNLHTSQLTIPVSQLGANGLYFYTAIIGDQKVFAGKFLIQR